MAADNRSLTAPHRRQGYEILPISQRDLATRQTSVPLILPNDFQYDPSSGKVVKQPGKKRTHLVVVEEALELLRDVTDPVSVLGICGTARSGKSYVLSRMAGAHDAFELGNQMNSQTFGIWMGTKVLRNKEKGFTTILIDSEGTDAFDADSANDVGILVMTVLLTSQLIYNTKNVPKKKDLEELKALTDVTGKIRAKENEAVTEEMGELRRVFPNFMWLLRDVYLECVHPDTGEKMTATDYVKTVVFRKDSQEAVETSQDRIGRVIFLAFRKVEAFTLPLPGLGKVLLDIAANAENIDAEFNERMDKFIEHILSGLECKRGMTLGSKITGDQLATMLKDYVKAVNDPVTIPAMKSAWDASVELRRKKILEDMVAKYNTEMTKAIEVVCRRGSEMDPMEERDDPEKETRKSLMSIHDTVMDNVRNELNKQIGFLGWDKDNQDHSALLFDLNERIVKRESQGRENSSVVGGELLRYIQKNRERSRHYCEKVFKRLLDGLKKRLDPIPEGYTNEKLDADLAKLKESYLQQAIGPMKLDVQRERWDSSDITGFFKMCMRIEGFKIEVADAKRQQEVLALKSEKQKKDLQKLRDESARQMIEHKKDLKKMSQNHETALKKQKEENDNERKMLNGKIEDLEKANHINAAERAKAQDQSAGLAVTALLQGLAYLGSEAEVKKLSKENEQLRTNLHQIRSEANRIATYAQDLKERGLFGRVFNLEPK